MFNSIWQLLNTNGADLPPDWAKGLWPHYGGYITGGSYDQYGDDFSKWASGPGATYLERYGYYQGDPGAYQQWSGALDEGKANWQTWQNTQRLKALESGATDGGPTTPQTPYTPRELNVPEYRPLTNPVSQWGASPITPSAGGVPFGGITDLVNRQQQGSYTPFQGVPSTPPPGIPAALSKPSQFGLPVAPPPTGVVAPTNLPPGVGDPNYDPLAGGAMPRFAQGGQVGMPANALYGQHGNPNFGNSISDQAQLGGGQGFGDTVSQQAKAISSQAEALSNMGRGPDDNLVHMSNREVGALQQMSPTGQLPINPQTGLPEAGILDRLLPIAGGIVGGMVGGPLGAAAGSGLGTVIGGGSLEQGLLSGIMSFGVGSILGNFAELGATPPLVETAKGTLQEAATVPIAGATEAFASGPAVGGGRGLGMEALAPSGSWAGNAAAPSGLVNGAIPQSGISGFIQGNTQPISAGSAWSGVQRSLDEGSFFDTLLQNPIKGVGAAGYGALGLASSNWEEDRRKDDDDKEPYDYRRRYMSRDVRFPGSDYNPNQGEWDYYSDPVFHYAQGGQVPIPVAPGGPAGPVPPQLAVPAGGIAGPAPQPDPQQLIEITKAAIMDQVPPEAKQQIFAAFIKAFGPEALEELMVEVAETGGQTKGPGDGQSDSIPAAIDGQQPAALSTDEFVVPADVVSHLGNGSSDAGSERLYDMLDRVRGERTGTTKEPTQVNPERLLPA